MTSESGLLLCDITSTGWWSTACTRTNTITLPKKNFYHCSRHTCNKLLALICCWIVYLSHSNLAKSQNLFFCEVITNTYSKSSWHRWPFTNLTIQGEHEKSCDSLSEAEDWKVDALQPLVVRVSKHNKPWGHITKNRRKGETRCRLTNPARPVSETGEHRSSQTKLVALFLGTTPLWVDLGSSKTLLQPNKPTNNHE